MKKKKEDIETKVHAQIEAMNKARAEAKACVKYPLGEFPDYDIVDVVEMLRRHRNKKITDKFIESVIWELKS